MARARSHYVCQDCGASHSRWSGKCEQCGGWNTLVEEAINTGTPGGLGKKGGDSGFGSGAAAGVEAAARPPPTSCASTSAPCAARRSSRMGNAARRSGHVMKRSSPKGPSTTTVVATAAEHADPHYFDLAVSRSIGDWVGPDMVLPHPSTLAFDAP